MRSYTLNIAGYNILFQAKDENLTLEPSPPQESFITDVSDFDIAVNVSRGPVKISDRYEQVFKAPYVEEINGFPTRKSEKFWTVYKHGDYIIVHTTMPLSDSAEEALLIIRPGEKGWDIIVDCKNSTFNPIEYPLDGLLIYYITAINGDIFIHGSALCYRDKGFLFTGPSGKGKSTIARLFNESGAKVIHDDRLIIRKTGNQYLMYNTPVSIDDKRSSYRLDRIYIIEHGKKNRSEKLGTVRSLTSVMSNCIQHHWNSSLIAVLTGAIMDLTEKIEVTNLSFIPDSSVVDFIANDSHQEK